jgi:hypothetical protein
MSGLLYQHPHPHNLNLQKWNTLIVGLLKNTDLQLELVQDSDYFGVIDAVDGVIAMAWEKFDFESENERLTFKFGESIASVTKKLKQREYILLNEEIKFKNI